MKKSSLAFIFLFLMIYANRADAQLTKGEPLDKIVAVVGNEIILKSDIMGQIALMAQQNPQVNPNDPAVYKQLLDALVNEKLLVTKAIEDSVVVSEDQIEGRWEAFLQTLMHQFGSEERIEQVYKKSLNRLKYELRDDIRNKLLSSNLVQQKIANITITPKEINDFYVNYRDSLPKVPETVEVYHITKYIQANTQEKKRIYELARSVRDSILRGGDFGDFAKRYSGDESTAPHNGELGWIEKGKFIPEFENAAFALQNNEISLPVETPFGFHLIQILDKKAETINTRHILFKISQTSADEERVVSLLDSLRKTALAKSNFSELARQNSDDKETKGYGGLIGKMPYTEMPSYFRESLEKLQDGAISEPIAFNADPSKPAYHIIWKKRTIPAHNPTVEEDYNYINDTALDMKKMRVYNEFIEQLRSELYWEVKD